MIRKQLAKLSPEKQIEVKLKAESIIRHNRLYERGCTRWGFIIDGYLEPVTYRTRRMARSTIMYRLHGTHPVKLIIRCTGGH